MTMLSSQEMIVLSFNTDDGIWRATMEHGRIRRSILMFSFNTDDGIWRATICRIIKSP